MILLFVVGIILVLVAAWLISLAFSKDADETGVGKSLAVLEAMTTAPEELKAELDRPFSERVVTPLQQRALGIGRRLSGGDSAERLRRKLDFAGNPADMTPDRVVSLKVIAAVALAPMRDTPRPITSIALSRSRTPPAAFTRTWAGLAARISLRSSIVAPPVP